MYIVKQSLKNKTRYITEANEESYTVKKEVTIDETMTEARAEEVQKLATQEFDVKCRVVKLELVDSEEVELLKRKIEELEAALMKKGDEETEPQTIDEEESPTIDAEETAEDSAEAKEERTVEDAQNDDNNNPEECAEDVKEEESEAAEEASTIDEAKESTPKKYDFSGKSIFDKEQKEETTTTTNPLDLFTDAF